MQAIVESVIYHNETNGYTILSCSTSDPCVPPAARTKNWGSGWCFTACGNYLPAREGAELELGGAWATNAHGLQLQVEGCSEILPKTTQGLIGYLGSGLIKGIGPKTAKAIVDRFGLSTLDVLGKDPQQLLNIKGITPAKLTEIVASYKESVSVRELVTYLSPYGISIKKCQKIQKHFEGRALDVLREEPFMLCDISGFGFKTADKIARDLHHDPAGVMRIRGALRYIMDTDLGDGHVFTQRDDLLQRALVLLNEGFPTLTVPEELVRKEANWMVQHKALIYEKEGNGRFYLPFSIIAERAIAFLAAGLLQKEKLPNVSDTLIEESQQALGIKLQQKQTAAVRMALENRISILTGGPGTGKTTVLQVILDVFGRLKRGTVLLAAPTGRASRRMAQSCHFPASTLHSALGIITGDDEEEYMTSTETLDADFVIVDESSMLDLKVASALFSRLKEGASLLLVGDADQLPPVGAGMVFKDLIDSGAVPVTRLTDIFRQAQGSHIPINAALICGGSSNIVCGNDFSFVSAGTPEETAAKIIELYHKEQKERDSAEIQVLTPLRKKGDASVNGLNPSLHDLANPAEASEPKLTHGAHEYRLGDRVLQLRNQGTVSNGDIGVVTAAGLDDEGKKFLQVDFSDGRVVEYGADDLGLLDWAYAMSVHKAQGSEFPVVIVPVLFQFHNMLRRDLYYTAVSRAKEKVILVGQWAAFRRAVETSPELRRTTLAARLQSFLKKEAAAPPTPNPEEQQMKMPA